jgi:hypothetical protein
MVLKFSIDGGPYRMPPYCKAEWEELMRGINNPPISYFSHRRSAPSPEDQEPPKPPPADTRPEREQP